MQGHLVLKIIFQNVSACLGCAAKYRIVEVIDLYPANRNIDNAVLRNAAMTAGIAPQRTCEASSPRTTSRSQCDLFSIAQCPRRKASRSAGVEILG